MRRLKYALRCALLATVLAVPPALADEASEAVKRCDALASHPSDPDRYSAGVTDEQFAPGAAVDACKDAQRLNPNNARIWFELGRAYWIGRRDGLAFSAFVQAANRDYAPAMKFIGDAYMTGRGLPSGQQRDAQTALQWYKKSAAGGFSDASDAADQVNNDIAKRNEDEKKSKFDPDIFQNKPFMVAIYNGDKKYLNNTWFIIYLTGFVSKLGGTEPFFVNGTSCLPQIAATTRSRLTQLQINIGTSGALSSFNENEPHSTEKFVKYVDQGGRDGIALFNRYGCDGSVTHRIIGNINLSFAPRR